jgi:hypothetical protein
MHESTQTLCSFLQPVCPPSDMRHQDRGDGSHDPRVMRYTIKTGEEFEVEAEVEAGEVETGASYTKGDDDEDDYCEERIGVHHLVSGWIQQAQADKARFTCHASSHTE